MNYLSLCSGIEAATVAWHPLSWQAVAFSEIEKFPSEVLAHHYPQTPNLGDMTKFKEWNLESTVDLLVGGTPCQSFSVAGLRKGLDDPRGNLMLTYLAIADKYRPRWLVWENVPGVLSSNGGKDFGTFLGAMGELGYGFAYRVLDAQYFGVAQRRRRVFVVGYLGDWRPAAAVLFERQSLSGDPAPSREKKKDVTECVGTLTANGGGLNRPAGNANELDFCIPFTTSSIANYREGIGTLRASGGDIGGGSVMNIEHDMTGTLRRETHGHEPVVMQPIGTDLYNFAITGDVAATMSTAGSTSTKTGPTVMQHMAVRRLTPVECERLQGFPDNYTDIKSKSKPTPDSPRYKALGNSMAVPVMRWIGERIKKVEEIYVQR